MIPHLEKPRITEIQVRIDCNGCEQKIRKALHGINGIYDVCIDFRQQKLTLVGWADPERVIKAIKKTGKIATICSHAEAEDPQPQPTEPPAEGGPPAPPPEATNPAPGEAPPAEPAKPEGPTKESPPPRPENPPSDIELVFSNPFDCGDSIKQPSVVIPRLSSPRDRSAWRKTLHILENPMCWVELGKDSAHPSSIIFHSHPSRITPSPVATETSADQSAVPQAPKDVETVHIIHHHYHDNYSYDDHWKSYSSDRRPWHESQHFVTHSYNNHTRSVPHHVDEQHSRRHGGGDNITSMFSDENPNACTIV